MSTGDAMLVLLGVVMIAGAGYQEWSWRKRLKGKRYAGRIVATRDVVRVDETEFYPVVEYDFEGETRKFTSNYGSSIRPRMEASVVVMVAPGTGQAEVLSTSNRLVGTLALLGGGVVLLLSVAFGT